MQIAIAIIVIFTMCCSAVWAAPQATKLSKKPLVKLAPSKKPIVTKKVVPTVKSSERNIRAQDLECAKLLDQVPQPLASYLEQVINKGDICSDVIYNPFRVRYSSRRIQPNDLSHQVGEGLEIGFDMSSGTDSVAKSYYYDHVTYQSKLVRMGSNDQLKRFEPMLGDLDKYVDSDALKDVLKPASIEHQALSGLSSTIKLKPGELVNHAVALTQLVKQLSESGFAWLSSTKDWSSDFKYSDQTDVFVRITPMSEAGETGLQKVETITIETYENIPL
ncbi:MAG: hypothetical protein K2Y22_14820 [Candidatus Obscuribacterales bacterium]|nr:hypothetical protein [Candidatus Obscuribacterales bacterium]